MQGQTCPLQEVSIPMMWCALYKNSCRVFDLLLCTYQWFAQDGGGGQPMGIWLRVVNQLGRGFDILNSPLGEKFYSIPILESGEDLAKGGNLTLNGDPRVGKLTFENLKMSNSPGVSWTPILGQTIDRRFIFIWSKLLCTSLVSTAMRAERGWVG